jgi:CubicO group peptidase (beta-lactamase class C family)
MSETMTLRDVLCHRSGLPRHDLMWAMNDDTTEGYMRRLRYVDADKPIRYSTEYNNFGFVIAGQAAAAVSGKPWYDLVQERILNKLGMNRTYPIFRHVPESEKDSLSQCYGDPTKPTSVVPRMVIDETGAAGSVVSNVEDMALWLQSWIQIWRGLSPLVSFRRGEDFRTPNMLFPLLNRLFGSYALGTWIEQYRDTADGYPIVFQHHGGNLNGMASQAGIIIGPRGGNGSGIVILTNQNGSPAPRPIFLAITDILYPKKATQPSVDWNRVYQDKWNAKKLAQEQYKKNQEKLLLKAAASGAPSLDRNQILGSYSHPAYGTVNVAVDAATDKLIAGTFFITFSLPVSHIYDFIIHIIRFAFSMS